MIIDNLDLNRIGLNPEEADPPLVVDPNAVLPQPIAAKFFQTIPSNHPQIGKGSRGVNLVQLSLCYRSDALELSAELTPKDPFALPIPERPDH